MCTLSTYNRIETRLQSQQERDWNTSNSHDDDTARPGASCLTGMEERLVEIEILKTQGREVLKVLCDATKFFDTIDPRLLGQKLAEQDYGNRKACHTMITHLGPRVFKISGHFGNITESCGRSILAGCQRSLSLCRAYTNSEVEELRAMQLDEIVVNGEIQDLHGAPQGHWIKQHVDDLTLIIWSIDQKN